MSETDFRLLRLKAKWQEKTPTGLKAGWGKE
jgi:hypothetical protein